MTEPFLPIRTERLVVRSMRDDDVAGLHAYRNGPHVEHQDWDLPYPMEQAVALVRESAPHDGPVRGDWVQMAIDVDGVLVGDVAVGLDDAGEIATIGYTLRDDMQGRGYAREAVGAVVERLFAHTGVHRIEATTDPANGPSQRLLLALGFTAEGVSRQSVKVRGVWCDDARYGLLETDRRPGPTDRN